MIKKISYLIVVVFVTTALVACGDKYDGYTTYYIYKNNSSRDITIESYYYDDGFKKNPEVTFVISAGYSSTLGFVGKEGYSYPFRWNYNASDDDFVIVSNWDKQFKNTRHSRYGDTKLYLLENYEIIDDSPEDKKRTYQYVFTDKDFENAGPME